MVLLFLLLIKLVQDTHINYSQVKLFPQLIIPYFYSAPPCFIRLLDMPPLFSLANPTATRGRPWQTLSPTPALPPPSHARPAPPLPAQRHPTLRQAQGSLHYRPLTHDSPLFIYLVRLSMGLTHSFSLGVISKRVNIP